MDISRLVICLADIVPIFEDIEGLLFIRRQGETLEELKVKIAGHSSLAEAQSWINIVLIDSFIDEVVAGKWSLQDPSIPALLQIYERAWAFQIAGVRPRKAATIEQIIDEESGDVGLRLVQER
jgi:hypothetical protein